MSAQDNATKLGKPNQNLVLETAGRIYVKVQDRFYELDFRNQNNKSVVNVTNNITEAADSPDLSGFVTKKYLKASLAEYVTKRTWAGIKETTNMLENALLEGFTESISPITINTMQLVVGSEQLQYDFIRSFTDTQATSHGIEELTSDHLELNECYIKHYTINGPNAVRKKTAENTTEIESQYCRWHIAAGSFDLDDGPYYLYLKVPILGDFSIEGYPVKEPFGDNYMFTGESNYSHSATAAMYWKTNAGYAIGSNIDSLSIEDGEYVISQSAISFDSENGYYHLLFAIINSASDDGEREFTTMNGFTEITPGRITAYRFVSPDGGQYLNFLDKTFHLGDAALDGEIPTTGNLPDDYRSYIHWDPINGLIIKGKVELTGGDLQDVLDTIQNQIDGSINSWFSGDPENNNSSITPEPFDLHCEPTLETWPANTWTDHYDEHLGDLYYITDDTQAYKDDQSDPKTADTYKGFAYRFVKETDTNNQIEYKWILLSDDSISEALRIAYENRDKISGYEYLKEALNDGKTIANGGLVLTSLIELGNWSNDHISVHAGINGLINDTQTYHDIAAWYGGPMEDQFEWNTTNNKWVKKSSQPLSTAKSLFRHDGSGYLANGEIYWQSDGSLRIPGITLEGGQITLDSGVIISGTNTAISEYNAFFESVTVNGVKTVKLKNEYAGLWAEGFGSFGGINPSSESGISLDRVWDSLTSGSEYVTKVINSIHLPSLPVASASTIGGVKIGNGLSIANDGTLSVIGGGSGSGSVNGVQFDSTVVYNLNTSYLPDQSGIIKLPAYPSDSDPWTDYFGIDANGNVYVKPIVDETNQTSTPRGFYNEGFGSFGGLNNSGNSGISLDRVWQSLTSNSEYVTSIINPIHIPIATNSTVGGIKTNYTTDTTNKNYAVQVDNSGNAYVNVPWSGGDGGDTPSVLPNLYIAQTLVSQTSSVGPLLGISGITNTSAANTNGDLSYMYWDSTNNAWHLKGNLIADGYGSFGGINSQSGSTTSLLDVWKSLTNNNNLNDYSSTTKIHLDHISINEILSQYVLPTATIDNLGGVKLGDSTQRTIDVNNKIYGVGVTETGQLAVYVPWSGGGSGGNIDIIVPTTTPTLTNGDTILATINSVNIKAKIGTYVPMTVNNGNYFVSDNLYTYSLIPRSDNTYYLGYNENNTTRRWKEIWGVNIYGNTVRGSLYDLIGNNYVAISTAYQTKITSSNKLDYSLLSNTPTIPAAQVQSDWNATTGVAAILNKPTIPAAQIQSDWTQNSTSALDYIKNKPTIPTITLNGSGTTSPSFYAPTDTGTNGQFLIWNGAPSWQTKNFLSSVSLSDLPKGNTGTVLIGKGNSTAPEFSSTPTITSLTIGSGGVTLSKVTNGLGIDNSVILSSGKFYDSSDIRLKTKIEDILYVLDKLDYIPIVRYEYLTQKDRKYIGTLAQPLLSLYPELVNKDDNGYYSVDYGGLAAVAIAGLKELSQKVKSLEAKLYGYEY